MIDRTDEETGELIRDWLQRYGLILLIVIIAFIAAVSGYRWWNEKQQQNLSEQAGYLISLHDAVMAGKDKDAAAQFAKIDKNGEMFAFANLLMARLAHQNQDDSSALNYLAQAEQAKDKAVADLASWQKAKLELAMGNADAATTDLQHLNGTLFGKEVAGLRGVIEQNQGQLNAAAKSYAQAAENTYGKALFSRQAAILNAALSLDKHSTASSSQVAAPAGESNNEK